MSIGGKSAGKGAGFQVRRGAACTVGAFVPQLTRKAFEKYGFATAEIAAEWSAIVGEKLSACTMPERLKWPRAAGGLGDDGRRDPAVLTLRVEPAFALEVQYQSAQLIERINTHFGYRAVGEVRIIQGSVMRARPAASVAKRQDPPAASPRQALAGALTGDIAGAVPDGLAAALSRLEANIASTVDTAVNRRRR